MQKGFVLVLILVGVLIIAAIGGGAYYLGTRKPSVSVPSPVPVATSPASTQRGEQTPQSTPSPVDETLPVVQIGYETVKLHNGKNSFELEVLVSDSNFRPTQATVYDAYGKTLKTYEINGPWTSLCFDNKKVYKAIGTMDEITGYKNVEIVLINNINITRTVKKELGEHCRLGTISIE